MYNAIKTGLSDTLGISKDALHIHIGLFIFLVVTLLLRRPRSFIPWLAVLGFEAVNELLDLFHDGAAIHLELFNTLGDIGNTMLWPTVALVLLRLLGSREKLATP